ncbi:putative sigma-54 dependent response regulator [Chlamydia trachomatis]|nr:putative sigma-54 dependent response regulator [Chlamydia trachomatis]
MKVGSSEVQRTDIRVVAATNVDLAEAVKRGRFRQDLLYRLNTVTIELPPLRERGDDISLLFRKFASDFADKYQMPPIRLSEDGQKLLETYSWPGNIRELRNLVERLSVLLEDRVVTSEVLLAHLPANALVRHPALISDYSSGTESSTQATGHAFEERMGGEAMDGNATLAALYTMLRDVQGNVGELTQLLYRLLQTQHMVPQPIQSLSAPAHNPITDLGIQAEESELTHAEDFHDLLEDGKVVTLKEMEERYIDYVLRKNHGARRQTAEDLDISERTLYRKLNREG